MMHIAVAGTSYETTCCGEMDDLVTPPPPSALARGVGSISQPDVGGRSVTSKGPPSSVFDVTTLGRCCFFALGNPLLLGSSSSHCPAACLFCLFGARAHVNVLLLDHVGTTTELPSIHHLRSEQKPPRRALMKSAQHHAPSICWT